MSDKDLSVNSNDTPDELLFPSLEKVLICKEDIEELFDEYGKVLAPKIVEYEVEQCEFPVEVLNEIRAIYAHLYRASVAYDESDIVGNVKKAKSHSKRAVLDCYKYLCVIYDKRFHQFYKKFGYINWSKSDLIEDIATIDKKRSKAVELLQKAKIKESTERLSGDDNAQISDDYRFLYKSAYDEYVILMKMLQELEEKIIFNNPIVSRFPSQIAALIGVLGIIIGIVLGCYL